MSIDYEDHKNNLQLESFSVSQLQLTDVKEPVLLTSKASHIVFGINALWINHLYSSVLETSPDRLSHDPFVCPLTQISPPS